MELRSFRLTKRSALAVAALVAITATTLAGCKLGGSKDDAPTAAPAPDPAPPPAAAPDSDVTRYAGLEQPETGTFSIRAAVPARKSADRFSAQVVLLQPGSAVTRVAQYGPFTLVSWNNGATMGWVETAVALHITILDGGTTLQPTTLVAPAGIVPQPTQPGVVAPQPVAPQPVAVTPPAQPPVVAPPQPVAPKPPAPVPPSGFKPPKLH